MPYVNGKRVSTEEYLAANGRTLELMRTGPRGENPAEGPAIDPETGAPPVERKTKSGGKRSPGRSTKAAKAAVANALGVSTNSPTLDDIDTTGLDAGTEE